MRRIQFIEIHDQPWFPRFLRDCVTADLQILLSIGNPYHAIVHRLRRALERSGTNRVLDLCSGAGGPWPWLYQVFEQEEHFEVQVCLTDKYPNLMAREQARTNSPENIHFGSCPVDATQVPPELRGFRTFFASFHHFPPGQARRILQDAIASGQGIGIFELAGRHLLTILLVLLIPIADIILVPILRPMRWSQLLWRLLWTLLIPIVPAVLLFDGVVSCLRVYSPRELEELTAELASESYVWEIGVEKRGFWRLPVTYLLGQPARQ
jgi:hypothetical protein